MRVADFQSLMVLSVTILFKSKYWHLFDFIVVLNEAPTTIGTTTAELTTTMTTISATITKNGKRDTYFIIYETDFSYTIGRRYIRSNRRCHRNVHWLRLHLAI